MKKHQSSFIIVLLLLVVSVMTAQVTPGQQALIQQELDKRGLTEDEVRMKLEERGIDIDNMSPEEALSMQELFEEIEKEIKAERAAAAPKEEETKEPTAPKETLEEIEEAIDELDGKVEEGIVEKIEEAAKDKTEGATVEDVIAEKLAEEAVSDLPPSIIYGQQLFRDKTLAVFSRSREVIPDNAYVLGAGDEITISIWGVSQEEGSYTINAAGYIKPTGMSRIHLKGIPLGKARQLLRRRFAQFYQFRPEEFAVTVSKIRDITVNIYGEVYHPGGYQLAATNTVFNALVASGGPTDIGSVRGIRLIRGGEKPKYVDVYEFMLDPVAREKYFLQDNDIIHVGEVQKVVGINGAVKRPFRYELLEGEHLIQLIEYAGGFRKNAYLDAIQIKRFEDNELKLIDVDLRQLQAGGSDFKLLDGDEILVKTIPTELENFVEILGAVDFPAQYQYAKGDKVYDLLQKGILKKEARTDVAYLIRTREDGTVQYKKINIEEILKNPSGAANIALEPRDQITILSKTTFVDINSFSIEGAVRKPREARLDPGEDVKVEDAVLLAGGLKTNALDEAYIIRTNIANTKEKEYIRFNVKNALLNPDSEDNLVLMPLDKIIVYTKEDFADAAKVSIEGAVRKADEYVYDEGLRVADVVYFANGLEQSATDFAIIHRSDPSNKKKKEYLRINIREAISNPNSASNALLQANDRIQVFQKESFTDESMVLVEGAVRKPGEIKYAESLTLKDALIFAGGLKEEAATNRVEIFRVVMKNNQATKTTVATLEVEEDFTIQGDDFLLEPYDQVVVRSVPDFELQQLVTIKGEVRYPGVYALLDKNEKLSSLIARAGGLTKESFPEGALLSRPTLEGVVITKLDEALKNKKSNSNIILKNGDVISIPKQKDLVGINTKNTRAEELYPDRVIGAGRINVPYHSGKRANYYLKEYAVGVGEKGKRSRITVEYANGQLKRTRRFLFFNVYPKVKKGAVVSVGSKPERKKKDRTTNGEKKKTDWEKIVGNTVAQVTGILSLVLLLQQIN
ncbi:MAG TPA: hypothetical protein ENJ45_05650 [Phaeodactylibacter sp.]|nr:hypothetical protein [Phaeodactylibacter sp.]